MKPPSEQHPRNPRLQRDPAKRKPLKHTAPHSRYLRQLSIGGLWPASPAAIPIPEPEGGEATRNRDAMRDRETGG